MREIGKNAVWSVFSERFRGSEKSVLPIEAQRFALLVGNKLAVAVNQRAVHKSVRDGGAECVAFKWRPAAFVESVCSCHGLRFVGVNNHNISLVAR